MGGLEPILLDREVRQAAEAWRRARRRLRNGPVDEPFSLFRNVTRRSFLEVRERPEHDPLRQPLLRWLYRLLDDKANWPALTEVAAARTVATHAIDQPERGDFTLRALFARALGDAPRREHWLARFFETGGALADLSRRHWERRAEVASRLELESPDVHALSTPEIDALAEGWLIQSADAASEHRAREWSRVVELALGLEAARDFPARLTPDTLGAPFRGARLFDDLPLDPGELPRAVAPASYLRALRRLGAAFVDATAAKDQPFVIAHDPFGLRRYTFGALLSLLPLEAAFAKRIFGVSGGVYRDQARALARVVLIESRAAAARVLLRRAAWRGGRAYGFEFETLSERAFGSPLPPAHAGLVLRLRADDAQRFSGLLLAAAEARVLPENHDEDWFRNPRAGEELRAEAALPPPTTASREDLERGARALIDFLAVRLG